jgi:hypothetical protein
MIMNDSVYESIAEKIIDPDSNDMRMKGMLIDLYFNLFVFTDLSIMSYEHRLRIHMMLRGRKHIFRGIENACNIISLWYEIHILLLFYFKGNASRLTLKILVYEL